jgi:exonuclease SbcC
MIPLLLNISGFLSYREPVELDCTGFDLACIAGPNGAGKSSLLDAITWVLFGQARKRDDSLINAHCDMAQIALVFSYEGNHYRVWRAKSRDKTTLLEFHIHQDPASDPIASSQESGAWKPLTERSLRETEARIRQTLRLDYDTFVNASFFLQGKADQFTQLGSTERKKILGSILGLDTWETYRQKAGDQRKALENQISFLDGRLREIEAELSEESRRKANLERLQADLDQYSRTLAAQETSLESMRRVVATLDEQAKLVEALSRQLEAATRRRDEVFSRLAIRQEERKSFVDRLARASDIEAVYREWQEARTRLERWEEIAARFREQEKHRQAPLDEINTARNTLTWDVQLLHKRKEEIDLGRLQAADLSAQIASITIEAAAAEVRIDQRVQVEDQRRLAQDRLAEAKAENPRLKQEMDELKARIDQLDQAEGATCPICGGPLTPSDRADLIEKLTVEGKGFGDRFRANKELIELLEKEIKNLNDQVARLLPAEAELRDLREAIARLTSKLEALEELQRDWETNLAPRLAELTGHLETENYALEARALLAQIDAELKAIG